MKLDKEKIIEAVAKGIWDNFAKSKLLSQEDWADIWEETQIKEHFKQHAACAIKALARELPTPILYKVGGGGVGENSLNISGGGGGTTIACGCDCRCGEVYNQIKRWGYE